MLLGCFLHPLLIPCSTNIRNNSSISLALTSNFGSKSNCHGHKHSSFIPLEKHDNELSTGHKYHIQAQFIEMCTSLNTNSSNKTPRRNGRNMAMPFPQINRN